MFIQCLGNEHKDCSLDRASESPEFSYFVDPWLARVYPSGDSFNSLLHLWVAFNAWLAEVVEPSERMDRDRALVNAAARDAVLRGRFDELLRDDPQFKKGSEEFHSLWPVFNVRRLAKLHVAPWAYSHEDRAEYRRNCFSAGAQERDYEPRCFCNHQPQREASSDELQPIPLDWPHTLAAIYQVRCNLFHGGKTFHMRSDILFAKLAVEILWQVWGKEFRPRRDGVEI